MTRRYSRKSGPGLARDESGAAALEFALIAGPFLFMLMALVELGILFVLDALFHDAASQTGRLVRTGQAHERAMSVEDFTTELCGRMSIFADGCNERIVVDVRVIEQFTGEAAPTPVNGAGEFSQDDLQFAIGGPGDIIMVNAWMPHRVYSPLLRQGTTLVANERVVIATASFRNEPFGS